MRHYTSIAEHFTQSGQMVRVREVGKSNIDDTYLVTTDVDEQIHPQVRCFDEASHTCMVFPAT